MHINARLPVQVEIGAVRIDPDADDTEVVRTDGNNEVRNTRTDQSLLQFEITYPHSEQDANFQAVRSAYKVARGRLHSFDFQDHSEFEAADEPFGVGDGVETEFTLIKSYTFGSQTHERRIFRPVSPITLKADGVTIGSGYSVDYTNGTVEFDVAPADEAVLTWTGEFNIPVRFDSSFTVSLPAGHLVHVETMTLTEVNL
jgi:uncharacterized protein (TIGR02217 family)